MPTPIDRDELQRLLAEQRGRLIEVLPAAEYEDEHLPAAIKIPLKELDRETTRLLDRGLQQTTRRPVAQQPGRGCPRHASDRARARAIGGKREARRVLSARVRGGNCGDPQG
jgi:hypothetical protein